MSSFKSGDFCVVKKAPLGTAGEHTLGHMFTLTTLSEYVPAHWKTFPVKYSVSGSIIVYADEALQKIEDKPGEDETFQWAGKPQREQM